MAGLENHAKFCGDSNKKLKRLVDGHYKKFLEYGREHPDSEGTDYSYSSLEDLATRGGVEQFKLHLGKFSSFLESEQHAPKVRKYNTHHQIITNVGARICNNSVIPSIQTSLKETRATVDSAIVTFYTKKAEATDTNFEDNHGDIKDDDIYYTCRILFFDEHYEQLGVLNLNTQTGGRINEVFKYEPTCNI